MLKWDEDSLATAQFGLGGMDIRDFKMPSFRIASRNEHWNQGRETHDAWLVIEDNDGDEVRLLMSDLQRIPHGHEGSHETDILQTVRLPIAQLLSGTSDLNLDTTHAVRIEFPGDGLRGSIYISDIELSQ